MSSLNEYRHFEYLSKVKKKAGATEVVLATRIFNRDGRNRDLLSVVYATADHQVFAYGSNDSGCLGLATVRLQVNTPAPIKELAGKALAKLCSGNRFVLALTEAGQVFSWGDNKFGQLGLGKSGLGSVNKPVRIQEGLALKGEHIIDVSCGQFHVLLLSAGGHLYAFGSNVSGAIGNGTTFHQSKPVHLTALASFIDSIPGSAAAAAASPHLGVDMVAIAAGGWHSAALNRKGELFVWGWNEQGQCGQQEGDVAAKTGKVVRPQRVLLPVLDAAFPCAHAVLKSVQCGLHHTLVLTFEGLVWAMGSNEQGECAQDLATVKHCLKAVPVSLEEPVLDICALAKSRLSLARSQHHFYVWGQQKQMSGNNHPSQPNLPRKFTISQQVQSSLSFNLMLAHNEPAQFCLEANTNPLPFSSAAIVIADRNSGFHPSNGKLNHSFNCPFESDVVFLLGRGGGQSRPANAERTIFAQKTVLESANSRFLAEFAAQFCNKSEDDGEEKEKEEKEFTKLKNVTLTIGRAKLKFLQLPTKGLSYETLYAYLFYCYSNYLVIMPEQLVGVMQLCKALNNIPLLNLCLQFIETRFTFAQLTALYKCALIKGLKKVVDFCVARAAEMLQNGDACAQLYEARQDGGDLVLSCFAGSQGPLHRTLVHRLVLKVKSGLYQTLGSSPLSTQSLLASWLMQLNSVTSERKILLADCINFGTLFTPTSLELFARFVYCGELTPAENKLTVSVLIDLINGSKLIQAIELKAVCSEQLKQSFTVESVCTLYIACNQNKLLLHPCLNFIKKHFTFVQLAALYKCALTKGLKKVVDFCAGRAAEMLQGSFAGAQLYNARQNEGDLTLVCVADAQVPQQQQQQHRILAHRLVLKVKGELYSTLGNSPPTYIASTLMQLNSVNSEKELLLLDTINFGTLFTPTSLELFVRFVYCGEVTSAGDQGKLTIPVLNDLSKASRLIQATELEAFCSEQLRKSITVENVCKLYVTYSQDPENDFLVGMLIKATDEHFGPFLPL